MTEPFPIEPQLFELYGVVFEVLMRCWLVAALLLFAAAAVLILLSCREVMHEVQKREGKAASRRSGETSGTIRREMPTIEGGTAKLSVGRLVLWIVLLAFVIFPPVRASDSTAARIPLGLDEFIPVPEENRRTPEKVELGRQLFFDKRLSRDGTVACATCHIPERAFADGRRIAVGIGSQAGRRNVPTLLNRAYGRTFFWDGRVKKLEDQPLEAILNPKEMGLTVEEFGKRLNEVNGSNERKSYRQRLEAVFRDEPASISNANIEAEQNRLTTDFKDGYGSRKKNIREISAIHGQDLSELDPASQIAVENAAKAIATYVRTLLSGNSAFDRYEHGDPSALSDAAKSGLQIFRGKGNCIACHSGPLLSDEDFHNTGVSWGKEPLDLGRFEITRRERDRGKFKVPTLRNVAQTAPYMHDGSLATLEDVIELYSKGANPNPNLDREIRPLNLSVQEKADLVSFLKSLSGETSIQPAVE